MGLATFPLKIVLTVLATVQGQVDQSTLCNFFRCFRCTLSFESLFLLLLTVLLTVLCVEYVFVPLELGSLCPIVF